ncbi:MAG: ribosome biogenesis GTPase Der [Clostridia bacterium]|nr:ribosome biogenesis GTPase Der [Clostridia bacterium]
MSKPIVAVVGRPNVGKSSFFNRVAGRRISIVENVPGVTRDRLYTDVDWAGYAFTMIDTGGIAPDKDDEWQKYILMQAQLAIDVADVVLMIVDGREGVTPNDRHVAQILRKSKKSVILAVNKMENEDVHNAVEFYELGLGEPFAMSCTHGTGVADVLDEVVKKFKVKIDATEQDERLKIAIVGRPNAGKSSITNRLLGEERVVVSNVAGTTRDAIDVPFRYNNKEYILIDTAGIRRKNKIDYESVEGFSVMRSLGAIRRADIIVYVLDASDEITEQDVRVLGYIHEQGKPSVILYNKWDLVEKDSQTVNKYKQTLQNSLKFMDYFVVEYISAKEGTRFGRIMEKVEYVYNNACTRITTGLLNEILQDAMSTSEPPSHNGKRLKINYITQVAITPPSFAIFVNNPELVHFSYLRYLENCLRRAKNFEGTPIRIFIRKKSKDKE